MKNPSVCLVILTSNSIELTKEMLLSISKLDTANLKVECLIIDNGSSDGTEEEIKNYKLPNIQYKFIQNGTNLGYAGGNNVGIEDALNRKFEYIIIMNNDLILSKDLVKKMVNYMVENQKVGIASPKMYFAKGYEFHKDRYSKEQKGRVLWYAGGIIDKKNAYTTHRGVDEIDRGQYEDIEATDVANGACMIVRREVFEKIGLLDSSLFLYWEDADFSTRAIQNGYEVVYFPKTCVWHKVSSSTDGSGSPTNDYFLTRNRFYYALKYLSTRTRFAVFRDTLRILFFGREWEKKGAFDALIGRRGMGQWAIR